MLIFRASPKIIKAQRSICAHIKQAIPERCGFSRGSIDTRLYLLIDIAYHYTTGDIRMITKKKFSVMTFILVTAVFSICMRQSRLSNASDLPTVNIPGTELRTITSTYTKRSYDIYISLPSGYAQNKSKSYPVLYVLDGQWDFKLLDSIAGGLYYDGFIPGIILVGITYSGENPDYNVLRAMDYTPTQEFSMHGSGDGPRFLQFMKKELIPMIESKYKADSSRRVLLGNSLGGLFTIYAMLHETNLFTGYIASSPYVVYDGGVILKQEDEYAGKHKELPVKLFIGVGEREDLNSSVNSFIRIINERKYKNLKIQTMTIKGEGHASNKPESYNRGLKFIFQD
jgi:predicted alpha/beta superfamily hydrolase